MFKMSDHKSTLENFNSDLWSYHFKIDASIADEYIEGNQRRVICTINELVSFPCGLMPNKAGGYFINLNKETRTKLNLKLGDAFNYRLEKDNSKYGLPIPEEMEELLSIDDEASKYFHALTPGKQRSLLYLIGKPKTSATRIHKAMAVSDYLKEYKGKLDFKILTVYMKEYNRF